MPASPIAWAALTKILFVISDTGVVTYKEVPMTPGTQTLIVIATDAAGNFAQQQLDIELADAPILTITTGDTNILGGIRQEYLPCHLHLERGSLRV